jgi:hypothetical protein
MDVKRSQLGLTSCHSAKSHKSSTSVESIQGHTRPATEKPSSSQGKLRIEMGDGSVQEVDLSHVRGLTIEP